LGLLRLIKSARPSVDIRNPFYLPDHLKDESGGKRKFESCTVDTVTFKRIIIAKKIEGMK